MSKKMVLQLQAQIAKTEELLKELETAKSLFKKCQDSEWSHELTHNYAEFNDFFRKAFMEGEENEA